MNVLREQGTNVVETMSRLRKQIEILNEKLLRDKGLDLRVIFEETTYISSAINLVKQNIWIGGCLAVSILILFLRSLIPTAIIFIAIPVSVIGTFVAIAGLGLSINVISLAGLAFSIGMVVDASIVSMENIYRLRQKGKTQKMQLTMVLGRLGTHTRFCIDNSNSFYPSSFIKVTSWTVI